MPLGFADSIDGDFAYIWCTVDSVEQAQEHHSSVRMMPVVEFDAGSVKLMPNPACNRWGPNDPQARTKADWHKIKRYIGNV